MEQVARVRDATATELRCADRVVARYVWNPHLPRAASPRPYLHPVTTLGGTRVTGFQPEDHLHHLGASVAIPVLNGVNYWGGRTYLRGRGSVPVDNHGVQRHVRWLSLDGDRFVEQVSWEGPDGRPLASERRSVTVYPVDARSWTLRFLFTLTPVVPAPLTIESPGARGRSGAGYGGFFWRAPEDLDSVRAFGPDLGPSASLDLGPDLDPGAGATLAAGPVLHGSRLPWVALAGRQPGGAPWTLVFVAGDGDASPDPWFVRAEDYAGVCSALAWDRPLTVAPGGVLSRRMSVVIADGDLSPADAEMAVGRSREVEPA